MAEVSIIREVSGQAPDTVLARAGTRCPLGIQTAHQLQNSPGLYITGCCFECRCRQLNPQRLTLAILPTRRPMPREGGTVRVLVPGTRPMRPDDVM